MDWWLFAPPPFVRGLLRFDVDEVSDGDFVPDLAELRDSGDDDGLTGRASHDGLGVGFDLCWWRLTDSQHEL